MPLAFGPIQVILILALPVIFFVLAFFIGKKIGYNKCVKETKKI
jgi:hypothetical protein